MRNLHTCLAVAFLMVGFANAATSQPSLGEPFDLAVGQSIVVGNQGLRVGFTGIASDSRCPLDVVCVWEGDAAAQIWAEKPSQQRDDFQLHTNPQFQRAATYAGYWVSLLAVAPYPEIDLEIDPNDYVVTVVVTDASIPVRRATWGKIKALFVE
jgi:hypothetical protein